MNIPTDFYFMIEKEVLAFDIKDIVRKGEQTFPQISILW